MDRLKNALETIEVVKEEFGPPEAPICPYTIEYEDLAKELKEFLKKGGFKTGYMKLLIDPVINDPKAFIGQRLGTKETVDAETWTAVTPISVGINEEGRLIVGEDIIKKPHRMAYKLLPLDRTDIILQGSLERNVWREVYILKKMTEFILNKNGPPSLPIFYGYYICPNALNAWTSEGIKREIKETDPIKEYGHRALILLNELEDSDLGTWVKKVLAKVENPNEHIRILVWSIFAVMTYLQINLKFVHLDFHLGNILVRNIKTENKKQYWEYKFKDKSFYVPNEGYIFIVWDFYRSLLLNEDKPAEVVRRLLPEMRFAIGRSVLAPISGKIALNIKQNPEVYLPYVYAYDSYRFLNAFLNTIKRMNLVGVRLGMYWGMLNEAKKALVDDLPKKRLPATRPNVSEFPVGSPAYLFEKYLTKKEFKEKIKGIRINPEPFVIA